MIEMTSRPRRHALGASLIRPVATMWLARSVEALERIEDCIAVARVRQALPHAFLAGL